MAQTATMLITDLSGSTETRVKLGEERAEELRRAHDSLLTEQASAHGGNVIKGTGDGLIVAFAGTAEALNAAVAMQQALTAYARREGITLAMRVGVSAGDVTFENDDCFGTPVIEAERALCALADGGEILVADLVRLLARGRFDAELEARGPTTLKGLPEPIDVWAVPWKPVASNRGLRTTTPYVGREREREIVTECWAAATTGVGGLVLIAGEPGIGKTRLVMELCDHVVRPAGGVVLLGGCHDGDVVANTPFVEAFTDWVRRTPPDALAAALGHEAAVVALMAPAVLDALADIDEPPAVPREAEIARLHDAIGQVLLRIAANAPVLLVLDDLHWADDATIAMMRAVSRAARQGPILVIGTYRETDVDRRHPFSQALAVLQREVEPTRIALSGLDGAEVHALLERIAEHAVPEDLAAVLTAETEGNPFFFRETLLHLVEEGELRFQDGQWGLAGSLSDLGLPAGVRDVIGRRLSRLPDTTNRLLTAGALFEVAFPLPVAADVVSIDDDEALDAIDAALEARIVRATDTFDEYAFTHALFRHALVEELNPSRQVRMHRAIATALEKQLRGAPTPAQAAALMRHYHRSAALPNAEQAVPYAVLVADDAARRFARREEYDALAIALELLPDGDERVVELQRRYVAAAVSAGVGNDEIAREAEIALSLAAASAGADHAADVAASWAADASAIDNPRGAWRIAACGRAWLDPERRDATYCQLHALELTEREASDPEHPGIPLDTPERRELRAIQATLPLPAGGAGSIQFFASHEQAEHYLDRLLDESGGTDRFNRFELFGSLLTLGRAEETRDHLLVSIDESRRQGVVTSVVMGLAFVTRYHNILGEFDESDACLAEALSLLPRVADTGNAAFQVFGAVALNSRVRGNRLSVATMDTFSQWDGSPDTRWAWVVVLASRTLAAEGRTDEAIVVLEETMPVVERAGGWAQNYPLIVDQLAMALWISRRTDRLEVLERNLRAKIVEPDVRYPEVDGRNSLALLCALAGRTDEATHWFGEARRVLNEQATWPLLLEVEHAEALMHIRLGTRGDRALIERLLDSARARCAHPALAPWLPRIDELAAQLS